jgi:hypothetical protein
VPMTSETKRRQDRLRKHLVLILTAVRRSGSQGITCADVATITRAPNTRTAVLLRALEADGFVMCNAGRWHGLAPTDESLHTTAHRLLVRSSQDLVMR